MIDGKSKITARDIKDLSGEEIDKIQNNIDAQNMQIIAQAYAEQRITSEEKAYLESYYKSGMEAYRKVYQALYSIFQIPEKIVCMDPETGETETHVKTYYDKRTKKRKRKEVETAYDFKDITPFTCMRLEYRDKENNPIYIILPVMKKPARAIEKLEDYRKEYTETLRRVESRYDEHGDVDRYNEELRAVPEPYERLNDVLRFTITSKYYSGVEHIVKLFTKNEDMNINPNETRSLFKENDMANIEEYLKNKKSYFDVKMFLHLLGESGFSFNAEAQIKIHSLYLADLKTHKIYEEQRKLEERLKKERHKLSPDEVRQKEAKIKILKMSIQKINKEAIHEYNVMVLNKIRWIESGYKALRISPDLPDGTYKVCRNIIQKEYMVRPFKAFDIDKEFSKEDELNQDISKRNNIDLDEIADIARRYAANVNKNYPRTDDKAPVADREYKGIISKYRQEIRGTSLRSSMEQEDWDNYGKAKKYMDISNKNIYKDNYSKKGYWEDYEKAEKERKNSEVDDQTELEVNEFQAFYLSRRKVSR